MKVGILTWHKAINHGAILQCYASTRILKSFGADPVVLDYNWSIYDNENKKAKLLRRLRNFSITKFVWYSRVKKFFKKKKQLFDVFLKDYINLGEDYQKENGLVAVYIGSDMVFDLTEGYNPYMYGVGVNCEYIFTYAASFGYSTLESVQNSGHIDEVKAGLESIKHIGVRDNKTKELCERILGKSDFAENIDPVLCYGFDNELEFWDTNEWASRDYILVYSYDSTMNDKETVGIIKDFAHKNGLSIISCGYYHSWADESVNATPQQFIELFKHAKYILTDTFHGTVFSALFHKKFCVLLRNNSFKIFDLLSKGDLSSRIADNCNYIERVLLANVAFDKFDSWLIDERKKSLSYIQSCLEDAVMEAKL